MNSWAWLILRRCEELSRIIFIIARFTTEENAISHYQPTSRGSTGSPRDRELCLLEHIFSFQIFTTGGKFVRIIGIVRR